MTEYLRQLAADARLGDNSAENELLSHLRVRFLTIAKRRIGEEDAEDIAQEACMTISEGLRNGCPIDRFDSWAFTVLRNKIGNYLQHQAVVHRTDRHLAAARSNAPRVESDDNTLMKLRLIRCFRRLLAANALYARIINLSVQGYTTSEICERLHIKRGHLYVALQRARNMLGSCMGDEGSVE